MYKYNSNLLPEAFRDMFVFNSNVHSYNTRQSSHFHLHKITSSLVTKSVSHHGALLWNSLNNDIKSVKTLTAFKRKLKNVLLNNYGNKVRLA